MFLNILSNRSAFITASSGKLNRLNITLIRNNSIRWFDRIKDYFSNSKQPLVDKKTEDSVKTSVTEYKSSIPSYNIRSNYIKTITDSFDYNKGPTDETFISKSRARKDYILCESDFENLKPVSLRTANQTFEQDSECYLKSEVERKAVEIYGSMEAIRVQKLKLKENDEDDDKSWRELMIIFDRIKKLKKVDSTKKHQSAMFGSEESRLNHLKTTARVVGYAALGNSIIFLLKLITYYVTGSASMLSEAIHSLADILNQLFLGVGIYKSMKAPSDDHPYGWSRVRHVYALISGVGVLLIGCGATSYHGFHQLIYPHEITDVGVAFAVIATSMIIESISMFFAIKEAMKLSSKSNISFIEYVKSGQDPTTSAVILEDAASVLGLSVAGLALKLCIVSGSCIPDAIGSVAIGGLLGATAMFLINRNANVLVGKSIPQEKINKIINLIENDKIVRSTHDVKATELGGETVRFKAEINFDGRQISRLYLERLNVPALLEQAKNLQTYDDVEKFMLQHGEGIIDLLGWEVDRLEKKIKINFPEIRHVDLEVL